MNKFMQRISATCITIIASILLLDYYFSLLSINTIFALLYVIVVFFASIWATFMFLQNILGTNVPFGVNANKFLSILHSPFKKINLEFVTKNESNIDERIQNFVADIQEICIKKWYINYISTDDEFLTECSKLLDMVVRRFLQIAGQINSDKVLHGIVTILLRHMKEYKKAVKKAKTGGSVERHYRYAHVGSKNDKTFEYFVLQITSKSLCNFVHWELYNSLACRCLNAILAKKLVSYMIHSISSPGFINYQILLLVEKNDDYLKYQTISIGDVDHSKPESDENETENNKIDQETVEILSESNNEIQSEINAENTDDKIDDVNYVDGKSEEISSSNKVEVRVHEPRSANKIWRNSSDLDCISLGQDILILSNIAEEDISKPDWEKISEDLNKRDKFKIQPVAESVIASAASATAIVGNIKPTTTSSAVKDTMKDFQETTSNAMHKIEDEAAGVVEGIFDFGMAGIRKGLRLTGLQDNVSDQRPKSASKDIPRVNKTRLTKLTHVNSDEEDKFMFKLCKKSKDDSKIEEDLENFGESPFQESFLEAITPGYEGDILLEKSPMIETRTSSHESTNSNIPIMEFLHIEDSPDPEYEDNPDLATTTAKLRSLLAQKTEANTPLASPISLIPTPLDASGSSIDEISEVDNAIPSMYKAWAKTATGVFHNTLNTIKTALPGNANEDNMINVNSIQNENVNLGHNTESWNFIPEDTQENDFGLILEKFLSERQQFCVVDKAFEAVEAIDITDQLENILFLHHEKKYEEELDEFDTKIPISKALIDLICELVEDTFPPLVKENIIKTFMLVYGSILEEKLQILGEQIIKCITHSIGHLPKLNSMQLAMPMKIDEFVEPIVNTLSDLLGQWLDKKSLQSIVQLIVESLQSHKINVDTTLQILELVVSEVIAACNQASPSYSV